MTRNIVICCDGTGNEVGRNLSNVLKLFRILKKSEHQRVYYDPGVGTIGELDDWQRFKQKAVGFFGLATGYGLDDNVLDAYRFLAENAREDDAIWLFGFSRGAYTVRILAGFIHLMGLLPADQINLAGYALAAYKRISASDDFSEARHFRRVAGGRSIPIRFVGVWDTVSSVIVPRPDRFYLPSLQMLPFTRTNPGVEIFRQAIALDERRRMFRLNKWTEQQEYDPNPFDSASSKPQDVRQVWFSGVHADIGGGYPEQESGLSKFPLLWMLREAKDAGLDLNTSMLHHLAEGVPRKGSDHVYVPPDAAGMLHRSLAGLWRILEWLPKRTKWREWPKGRSLLGLYLPRGEPRLVPEGARIHHSVVRRRDLIVAYDPLNLPAHFVVERDHAPVGDLAEE